jgi:hypothetical protein
LQTDPPAAVADFLDAAPVLDNAILPNCYADPADLGDLQIGFRVDVTGANLCDGESQWRSNWWVLGLNRRAEPFFIDADEPPDYPVYFAYRGSSRWQALPVADCLTDFGYLLERLQDLETDPRQAADWLEQRVDVDDEVWGDVWSWYNDDIDALERRPVVGIEARDYLFGQVVIRRLGQRPDQVLAVVGHLLDRQGPDLANLADQSEIVLRRDRFVNLRELIDHLTALGATVVFQPDD